jgi:hypothetical protein
VTRAPHDANAFFLYTKTMVIAAATIGLAVALAVAATVTEWSPPGISSAQFESHAAFDPRNGDMYFVRSSPQFRGWRILTSVCRNGEWSPPRPAPFAADVDEADPWFTTDGRSLYFISNRGSDGGAKSDLDIWRVDRAHDGPWGTPQRLPAPVNSTGQEWFPRLAPDGWLYFGSDRPGGHGKTDIWRAREHRPGQWQVENAGPSINSEGDEYEAEISPDGSRMVLMTADGYYESRRTAQGWSQRQRMGEVMNRNGTEVGALFSPSGRSLLFARDTKGPMSGEFHVWHEQGDEAWPVGCTNTRKPVAW